MLPAEMDWQVNYTWSKDMIVLPAEIEVVGKLSLVQGNDCVTCRNQSGRYTVPGPNDMIVLPAKNSSCR